MQSALCQFLWRPGGAGGETGEGVPAFLDQGYFCAMLKKQFGLLRSKGFPDLPKQLCHTESDVGSPSLRPLLENVDVNKQTLPGRRGHCPRLHLQDPSCPFSWDRHGEGGHRSWLAWLPATVVQAGTKRWVTEPSSLFCPSPGEHCITNTSL